MRLADAAHCHPSPADKSHPDSIPVLYDEAMPPKNAASPIFSGLTLLRSDTRTESCSYIVWRSGDIVPRVSELPGSAPSRTWEVPIRTGAGGWWIARWSVCPRALRADESNCASRQVVARTSHKRLSIVSCHVGKAGSPGEAPDRGRPPWMSLRWADSFFHAVTRASRIARFPAGALGGFRRILMECMNPGCTR
jgi:hypothetical protein